MVGTKLVFAAMENSRYSTETRMLLSSVAVSFVHITGEWNAEADALAKAKELKSELSTYNSHHCNFVEDF